MISVDLKLCKIEVKNLVSKSREIINIFNDVKKNLGLEIFKELIFTVIL